MGDLIFTRLMVTRKRVNARPNQPLGRSGGTSFPSLPAASDPTTPLPDTELFVGLVGPTGTDLDSVVKELSNELKSVGYECIEIRLSDLILEYSGKDPPTTSEYDRIRFLMQEGTDQCNATGHGDFIARLGVLHLNGLRRKRTGRDYVESPRTAYVFRSLKRKEEVDLLRSAYGRAFILISVYSSVGDRLDALSRKLARKSKKRVKDVQSQALELINIDAKEEGETLGQGVGETFPLADYFVAAHDSSMLVPQLRRLIHLTFSNPYITPTRGEQAMYMAQAAALRSSSLSRQVGAAIVSTDGELLALGCNDAARFGGGLYWGEDSTSKRDVDLGHDTSDRIRQEILEDLFKRLQEAGWFKVALSLRDVSDLYAEAVLADRREVPEHGFLKESQILDVIEYGRTVHAEMAAITDAAKRGVSVAGAKLYCTTFPCHLCARHVVSSGIREVVYIEPYPKSRTEELFSDSIAVDPKDPVDGKVTFRPFVGVAPRRYFDFFQQTAKRKTKSGNLIDWANDKKSPRIKRFVLSYMLIEDAIIAKIPR